MLANLLLCTPVLLSGMMVPLADFDTPTEKRNLTSSERLDLKSATSSSFEYSGKHNMNAGWASLAIKKFKAYTAGNGSAEPDGTFCWAEICFKYDKGIFKVFHTPKSYDGQDFYSDMGVASDVDIYVPGAIQQGTMWCQAAAVQMVLMRWANTLGPRFPAKYLTCAKQGDPSPSDKDAQKAIFKYGANHPNPMDKDKLSLVEGERLLNKVLDGAQRAERVTTGETTLTPLEIANKVKDGNIVVQSVGRSELHALVIHGYDNAFWHVRDPRTGQDGKIPMTQVFGGSWLSAPALLHV